VIGYIGIYEGWLGFGFNPLERITMGCMLDRSVGDQVADLRRQFAAARPFRHVVIEPFLDRQFCANLMAEFPAFQARNALNESGEAGRKAVVPQLARLGPAYQRFDRLIRDRKFLELIGRITGIPHVLYDPDYVGGGTHENLDGQELDAHVDFNYHPSRPLHRRLNLIVFLNEEWDAAWGGCLELLRDPWATGDGLRREVIPLANRAVIFETTEASWHGFRRIQLPPGKRLSRRSLAVYFYTRRRPAEETAPAHGTVYYQRPLPEHIQAGHTLSQEDAAVIRTLLARRDQTIQFLYQRELKFSSVLAGIMQSPSFRLGRAITWPGRALRSISRRLP
jgi:Rps23 Pro-64 3,4-dihydroxylase Tpa1-like proline 4-hydroxylase